MSDFHAPIGAMASLHSLPSALFLLQLFTSTLLAILFLQSGIDKIVDRSGNLGWLTSHFAKSPLARFVPVLLVIITALELVAGTLLAIGTVQTALSRQTVIGFYGACLAAVAIICLFFGQRMAKDYPGAATLVPYFILTAITIVLLSEQPIP
jgi:uncharacterized membrane protein YphA (DoxX/SURF4 family)